MPFKNLTGLKKLTGLGAEVVGIAPLHAGQIVAAVTSDPVKLSVHPMSGGSGKVTNVALDEAHEAALLNKQVAVVKSGDDLWALLDIIAIVVLGSGVYLWIKKRNVSVEARLGALQTEAAT